MSIKYVFTQFNSLNVNEIVIYRIPSSQAKRLSMNDLAAIKVIKLEPGKVFIVQFIVQLSCNRLFDAIVLSFFSL